MVLGGGRLLGGPLSRRADQFRMNRLKDTFKERAENTAVKSPTGSLVKESVEYTNRTWSDNRCIFHILIWIPRENPESGKVIFYFKPEATRQSPVGLGVAPLIFNV